MAKKRGKKAKATLKDAGPIVLPSTAIEATMILHELAELNDRALEAQREYLDLKEQTKQAKDEYDKLAEQVLTRLREATHQSELPLFVEVRESDQARMEAGPEVLTEASGAAPGADLGSDEPEMDPEDSRRADAF